MPNPAPNLASFLQISQINAASNLPSILQTGQIVFERNNFLPRPAFPFCTLFTNTSPRILRSIKRLFNAIPNSGIVTVHTATPKAGFTVIYDFLFEDPVASDGHGVTASKAEDVGDHRYDRLGYCFRG